MVDLSDRIIAMEKAALSRWGKGDPDGFLEICAPDVVYFDPYREMRIDGVAALSDLYESIRGQIQFDSFEIINPHVQASFDLAVLTFNYVSYIGEKVSRWNCTECYRRETDGRWRIIQTHWSHTNVFKYHKM
jgi:ketosteroid isomerase-like protein